MFLRLFIVALTAISIVIAFTLLGAIFGGSVGNNEELSCENCASITVSRIIDGDTFESSEGMVGLYGVHTPGRDEMCYAEATFRLRELVGSKVLVQPGPRSRDENGRRLYYIFTEEGQSIDALLVSEGFGRAWIWDGQYKDLMFGLEERAKNNKTGCLWQMRSRGL
jgi:endonuclease YncB( thermonuclease family)